MKKALLAVAAAGLVVWVASWFRNEKAVATSVARQWTGGGGTLGAVFDRFPPLRANDASRKLTALAAAMPKNDAAEDFVRREIARGNLTIGQPPALTDISAIRELLLREPVVWESKPSFDDADVATRRAMQMRIARTMIADALGKARAQDRGAWEDLHAIWNLARTLDGHPQMMAQTAALTMARMVNAVAWKMPLPAPAWLRELQARDNVAALLEAFQYQTASYWRSGAVIFPTKMLADSVDRDREIAASLRPVTACEVKTRMNELGPDVSSVWRRAFRFRAEREETANALRVREGSPIETKSMCSDGTWSFDGTTLRFSREIPMGGERPLPLTLRLKP